MKNGDALHKFCEHSLTIGNDRKVIKSLSSFSSIPKSKYLLIFPSIKQAHDRLTPEQPTLDEYLVSYLIVLQSVVGVSTNYCIQNYFKTTPQITKHHKTLNLHLCM